VTLVKVCGLRRSQDVDAAVGLGAWAVGFILTESPRKVTVAAAARLAARVGRGVLTVAVFTTERAGEIVAAVAETGVRAVQLSAGAHGPSVPAVRAAISAAGLPEPALIAARDARGLNEADFILYDTRHADAGYVQFGGTGRTLDWNAVAALPRRGRVVLAGGIGPENARVAIRRVAPLAIDVCSSVEVSPGVKDLDRLSALFATVRSADAAPERAASDDEHRGRPTRKGAT
jgi:phosphoribosylanthranilate isomerase